jgi:hypothetical protein
VLIVGLFHSMHNAIVNSTGMVAVVDHGRVVVVPAVIIAVVTRGRLGLK